MTDTDLKKEFLQIHSTLAMHDEMFRVIRSEMFTKSEAKLMQDDIATLKEDVSGLKEDVSGLKHDFSNMQGQFGTFQQTLDVMVTELKNMRDDHRSFMGVVRENSNDIVVLKNLHGIV